jgi:hypothetical protein
MKLVKKGASDSQTPVDAGQTQEEAALFSILEYGNSELQHYITQNKFQNFRMQGYTNSK